MNFNTYTADNFVGIDKMTQEQTQSVFTAIRCGDEKLRECLIESGMTVAREMAAKYASSQASFDELFSESVIALYDAIECFNVFTDGQFDLFLAQRIKARVKEFYSNLSWFLPIRPRVIQLHDRYKAALLELYPECKNPESMAVQDEEYVAEYLKVSLAELRAMKSEYDMCAIRSLDELVINDLGERVPLIETIVDPATENGAAEYLDDLMDCLSADERYIVCAKNGVLSIEERTNEKIANEIGVTNYDVETTYQLAIDKLKKNAVKLNDANGS